MGETQETLLSTGQKPREQGSATWLLLRGGAGLFGLIWEGQAERKSTGSHAPAEAWPGASLCARGQFGGGGGHVYSTVNLWIKCTGTEYLVTSTQHIVHEGDAFHPHRPESLQAWQGYEPS